MSNEWQHVGELIAARRKLIGYRTQIDFGAALGVSKRTVGSLESGAKSGGYAPGFLEIVEDRLGWVHGSILRTVQGGRPRLADDAAWARLRTIWPQLNQQGRRSVVEFAERILNPA